MKPLLVEMTGGRALKHEKEISKCWLALTTACIIRPSIFESLGSVSIHS